MTNSGNTVTLLDEVTTALEEFVKQEGNVEPPLVVKLDDTHFQVAGVEYVLIENYRDAFNVEALTNRYHDVLDKYDYIVGDWGYDQLRLKGFYKNTNKKVPQEKRIHTLEDYLYEYCNFGCAYFILQREGAPATKSTKTMKENRRPRKNRRNRKAEREQDNVKKTTKVTAKQAPFQASKAAVKATYHTKDASKRNTPSAERKKQRNFAVKEVKSNVDTSDVTAVRRKTFPKTSKRKFEIRENSKASKE